MQFHDKTAYAWGLRYQWDPSLSMNPVRRFAHFMPPCIWTRLKYQEQHVFVFLVPWLFLIFCFESSGKASSIKSSSSSTHLHPSFTLSNPSRLPICASTKSIWGPIKNIYAATSEYLCTNHNVFVLYPKGICGFTKTCNCTSLNSGPMHNGPAVN